MVSRSLCVTALASTCMLLALPAHGQETKAISECVIDMQKRNGLTTEASLRKIQAGASLKSFLGDQIIGKNEALEDVCRRAIDHQNALATEREKTRKAQDAQERAENTLMQYRMNEDSVKSTPTYKYRNELAWASVVQFVLIAAFLIRKYGKFSNKNKNAKFRSALSS